MKFLLSTLLASVATADITGPALQRLLSQSTAAESRGLEEANNYDFLASYSLKFQGCHHVQQWNNNVDEENDVRIMTKRLARFRLCPSDQCSSEKSAGCTSKFGDYIVDLNTFVSSYLEGMQEDKENYCGVAAETCAGTCGNDDADCMETCYDSMGLGYCLDYVQDDDANNDNGFNIEDYYYCQQIDLNNGNRRLEDGEVKYYIGPYCAAQGGEVRLGVFTDDTCTAFYSSGASLFSTAKGFDLPFYDSSLITSRCLGCGQTDDQGNTEAKGICTNSYQVAGKCETRMSIDYPNESSCGYIEGIKIIREDGVIRTSTTKKSKAAAVSIGLFLTLSVLLAGYVYYLRTKLGRAQINLAAASQPLT